MRLFNFVEGSMLKQPEMKQKKACYNMQMAYKLVKQDVFSRFERFLNGIQAFILLIIAIYEVNIIYKFILLVDSVCVK